MARAAGFGIARVLSQAGERKQRLLSDSLVAIGRAFLRKPAEETPFGLILDQLWRVVSYRAAAALMLDGDCLAIVASRGGSDGGERRIAGEPGAGLFDVLRYEPPEISRSQALGVGIMGTSHQYVLRFPHGPKWVEFEATSNAEAPHLPISAVDDNGEPLSVTRDSRTYVTRHGWLFRRDLTRIATPEGVGQVEAEGVPAFLYFIDNLTFPGRCGGS